MWIQSGHFQHIAHAFGWLFLRANLKVFFFPYSWLKRFSTDRELLLHFNNGKRCYKSNLTRQFLKNPFWKLTTDQEESSPCYYYERKQNRTLCCPVHPATLSSKGRACWNTFSWQPAAGGQTPVLDLTEQKRGPGWAGRTRTHFPQRKHRKSKSNDTSQDNISTLKRWTIWCLTFPGPSKMSNIDSFVTPSLKKL